MRMTRIRRLTVVAIVAGVAALASPAGAIMAGDEPPDPGEKPDLKVTALAVSPVGGDWSVSYTVANGGAATAPASTIAFNGGGSMVASRSVPSLAVGASRSGTLQIPRTADCAVAMNVTADSGKVVSESSETNNSRQVIGVVPPCPARYKVTAASFKAIDESGIDWTGSDEPYWIFNSVGTTGTATSKASQVFGGVDTGETWNFGIADSCIWGCSGALGAPAPFGIGLSVQLWEKDLGHVDKTLTETASFFEEAGPIATAAGAPAWVGTASTAMGKAMNFILGWADDDLLGTNTYAFPADGLAAALPGRGTSFSDTRIYEDGDAKYSLTMYVSRIV